MFHRTRPDKVFGISSNYRKVSYVDRGQTDEILQTYLARDAHIALRGESKCGKSWLRQKNIPGALVVQCRLGKTVSDIYVDCLSQLQIRFEVEKQDSAVLKGRLTAQGDIGIKILTALRLGLDLEKVNTETIKDQPAGHDINDLKFISDILKKSGRRLVIEDFHYMSINERKKFAFELKALWDYGLFVVVIGVWSQSNMVLFLNPDLSGRVHEIAISWNSDDLERVLDKGGDALNLTFTRELKNRIVELSYGNVGILQKLTLETLDQSGIRQKPSSKIIFENLDALESAALFYAEQLNPLYQQFARRVSSGIRNRKDSTGIYAHAMAVVIDSSDAELMQGLNLETIFEIANKRQPRIQKGNLRSVLEKIEGLQVDEDGRGLVLSYNESTADLTVVDRQLLLYRLFCTVRWPWEDLIAEAEACEQTVSPDQPPEDILEKP